MCRVVGCWASSIGRCFPYLCSQRVEPLSECLLLEISQHYFFRAQSGSVVPNCCALLGNNPKTELRLVTGKELLACSSHDDHGEIAQSQTPKHWIYCLVAYNARH